MKEEKRNERPVAYPRPTETDNQWQNQPEFIDQQPADFQDKSVSDLSTEEPGVQQVSDPGKERRENGES